MKNLVILCSVFLLFSQNCSKDSSLLDSNAEIKNYAHGYWEAVSGDINVNGEEALIQYSWYAIDTDSDKDSISVTWDDGRACTRSPAIINGNTIEFSAVSFDVKIEIDMNNGANASFKSLEKSYQKKLNKRRDDPTVLCL